MHINLSRKHAYNCLFLDTVCGKNGGVEFWQIAVDKANSEEYFGESDDRSLEVVSPYLQALLGKFLVNCASFIKFAKFSLSNIFPCTLTTLVPIP